MERGYVEKIEFVFKDHKIQLDKIYIKFVKVEKPPTGLQKTSFRIYLDKKYIGIAPLEMLAVISMKVKDKSVLQIVLQVGKLVNINNVPFFHKMKIKAFLGKIFKQDEMIETPIGDSLVIVSKDKTLKKRRKKRCRK